MAQIALNTSKKGAFSKTPMYQLPNENKQLAKYSRHIKCLLQGEGANALRLLLKQVVNSEHMTLKSFLDANRPFIMKELTHLEKLSILVYPPIGAEPDLRFWSCRLLCIVLRSSSSLETQEQTDVIHLEKMYRKYCRLASTQTSVLSAKRGTRARQDWLSVSAAVQRIAENVGDKKLKDDLRNFLRKPEAESQKEQDTESQKRLTKLINELIALDPKPKDLTNEVNNKFDFSDISRLRHSYNVVTRPKSATVTQSNSKTQKRVSALDKTYHRTVITAGNENIVPKETKDQPKVQKPNNNTRKGNPHNDKTENPATKRNTEEGTIKCTEENKKEKLVKTKTGSIENKHLTDRKMPAKELNKNKQAVKHEQNLPLLNSPYRENFPPPHRTRNLDFIIAMKPANKRPKSATERKGSAHAKTSTIKRSFSAKPTVNKSSDGNPNKPLSAGIPRDFLKTPDKSDSFAKTPTSFPTSAAKERPSSAISAENANKIVKRPLSARASTLKRNPSVKRPSSARSSTLRKNTSVKKPSSARSTTPRGANTASANCANKSSARYTTPRANTSSAKSATPRANTSVKRSNSAKTSGKQPITKSKRLSSKSPTIRSKPPESTKLSISEHNVKNEHIIISKTNTVSNMPDRPASSASKKSPPKQLLFNKPNVLRRRPQSARSEVSCSSELPHISFTNRSPRSASSRPLSAQTYPLPSLKRQRKAIPKKNRSVSVRTISSGALSARSNKSIISIATTRSNKSVQSDPGTRKRKLGSKDVVVIPTGDFTANKVETKTFETEKDVKQCDPVKLGKDVKVGLSYRPIQNEETNDKRSDAKKKEDEDCMKQIANDVLVHQQVHRAALNPRLKEKQFVDNFFTFLRENGVTKKFLRSQNAEPHQTWTLPNGNKAVFSFFHSLIFRNIKPTDKGAAFYTVKKILHRMVCKHEKLDGMPVKEPYTINTNVVTGNKNKERPRSLSPKRTISRDKNASNKASVRSRVSSASPSTRFLSSKPKSPKGGRRSNSPKSPKGGRRSNSPKSPKGDRRSNSPFDRHSMRSRESVRTVSQVGIDRDSTKGKQSENSRPRSRSQSPTPQRSTCITDDKCWKCMQKELAMTICVNWRNRAICELLLEDGVPFKEEHLVSAVRANDLQNLKSIVSYLKKHQKWFPQRDSVKSALYVARYYRLKKIVTYLEEEGVEDSRTVPVVSCDICSWWSFRKMRANRMK